MRRNQLGHESAYALHKLGLPMTAIRKVGVVGDVDIARVRSCSRDLAINGQPAEPGIEHQNGRCTLHVGPVVTGCAPAPQPLGTSRVGARVPVLLRCCVINSYSPPEVPPLSFRGREHRERSPESITTDPAVAGGLSIPLVVMDSGLASKSAGRLARRPGM